MGKGTKGEAGNMFSSYAEGRESDQRRIERSVVPKGRARREQFTIAMSPEHKRMLKLYAIERGMPASRIVEEWIERYAR